jgi:hypothetical protein
MPSQALVILTSNPSYSGGRDQEEHSSRAALANTLRPYFKNTQKKKAGGVAQVVGHLPSKAEALSSNQVLPQKKKNDHKIWT